MIGPHVFGDDRLGLYMMANESFSDKLAHRLPAIKSFVGGQITDLYLPESATLGDRNRVREAGLFCNLWTTPHGRSSLKYTQDSIAAFNRIKAGALELNIEEPDSELSSYITQTLIILRKAKPNLRVRVNIAPFKAGFIHAGPFIDDPNLFLIEQNYFGNMHGRASEADTLADMLEASIPLAKASIMYGVANYDPWDPGTDERVRTLPALPIRRLRRGSLFQDDLMANVGLI